MKYRNSRLSPAPMQSSCRKAAYQTKEDADDMIRYIKETRVTKEIRAYRCDICGMWHLTSRGKD